MVGFRLAETISDYGAVSRGICKTEDGYLKNVEEWTGIGVIQSSVQIALVRG